VQPTHLREAQETCRLPPIFAPVYGIVELLRKRTDTDYTELVEMIRKGRDELQRICEN